MKIYPHTFEQGVVRNCAMPETVHEKSCLNFFRDRVIRKVQKPEGNGYMKILAPDAFQEMLDNVRSYSGITKSKMINTLHDVYCSYDIWAKNDDARLNSLYKYAAWLHRAEKQGKFIYAPSNYKVLTTAKQYSLI